MIRFVLRRLGTLAVTLLVTSVLVFTLTELLPGDPTQRILGRDAGESARAALRAELGLDDPPPTRYVTWITDFVRGDWGTSYSSGGVAVRPLIFQRTGYSLVLAGFTLLLSVPVAIVLGVVAGLNENKWPDTLISLLTLSVVGLPEFVTALLLIGFVAPQFDWLTTSARIPDGASPAEWVRRLTLPALTASFVLVGYVTRMTRASVIDELKKPYVRAATLKGLPRRTVLFKHVLRNALLPTVTVIALSLGWLIGGLVVIENVFDFPGLGREMVAAVNSQDYPRIEASVMTVIFFFAAANLVADVLYALLNPRLRES